MKSPWWRSAVVYQIYIRSFADGNGDGVGDITGMRSRLGYLRDLGVDAVWVNPWYVSPMADAGYDVADYRDIDPAFGTLDGASAFIEEAHSHGIRVILDMVPNHCSSEHPWFRAALRAGPGSAERERFHFRPGSGRRGERPPNNWRSSFGGSAWTRITERDGTPGEWYLHLFAPQQPDFNWDSPQVRAEFHDILRFWLDRGADGFRIDAADRLAKDPALPDMGGRYTGTRPSPMRGYPAAHGIYQGWREVVDGYPGDRVLVAEIWMELEHRAVYHAPGELHTSFALDLLCSPWNATAMHDVIDANVESGNGTGAPATWVLGNHDVPRIVTRYGREETGYALSGAAAHDSGPADRELGTRRARAAALLIMALPGGLYIYQGDELGLWEVEDIPVDLLQDPVWQSSGHTRRGRDGCRVPLPWSGTAPPFGFSPAAASAPPWLPQPASWRDVTAAAQAADPDSMLSLYRAALSLRRSEPGLGDGPMAWLESSHDVLAFSRPGGFACVVNFSGSPARLPHHQKVLLSSGPLENGTLPPDTAAWLRTHPREPKGRGADLD